MTTRLRTALSSQDNWLELIRFAVVGASGYAVNLIVFALCFEALDLDHRIAATIAFAVAVTNNFLWNRLWTFRIAHGRIHHQAARFLTVSLAGFGLNLVLLIALVALGLPELLSQAIAVATVTPVNFIGNRLWTFHADRQVG